MARIPLATGDSVPQDQRAAFDELVQGGRVIANGGPFSVMMNVPEMARRAAHLSEYLIELSTLSTKTRELAIITTAREMDCPFIWNYHAAVARTVGIRDEIIDNMRDKKELTGLTPEESVIVNYGREFFRTHKVSKLTFDAALVQFGIRGLSELTNLMGWYAMQSFNVNAFETEPPAERTEELLPV